MRFRWPLFWFFSLCLYFYVAADTTPSLITSLDLKDDAISIQQSPASWDKAGKDVRRGVLSRVTMPPASPYWFGLRRYTITTNGCLMQLSLDGSEIPIPTATGRCVTQKSFFLPHTFTQPSFLRIFWFSDQKATFSVTQDSLRDPLLWIILSGLFFSLITCLKTIPLSSISLHPVLRWMGYAALIGLTLFTGASAYVYFRTDVDALRESYSFYSPRQNRIITTGLNSPEFIPYEQLPLPLVLATIHYEDQRFGKHRGVDITYFWIQTLLKLRSADPHRISGTSTISMQLARNLFLDEHRSLWRKWKEILLAKKLEFHFSKAEILSLYLDIVEFGYGMHGIREGYQGFFGENIEKINADTPHIKIAFLTSMIQAPFSYSTHLLIHAEMAENHANRFRGVLYFLDCDFKKRFVQLIEGYKNNKMQPSDFLKEISVFRSSYAYCTADDEKLQLYERAIRHYFSQASPFSEKRVLLYNFFTDAVITHQW